MHYSYKEKIRYWEIWNEPDAPIRPLFAPLQVSLDRGSARPASEARCPGCSGSRPTAAAPARGCIPAAARDRVRLPPARAHFAPKRHSAPTGEVSQQPAGGRPRETKTLDPTHARLPVDVNSLCDDQ